MKLKNACTVKRENENKNDDFICFEKAIKFQLRFSFKSLDDLFPFVWSLGLMEQSIGH